MLICDKTWLWSHAVQNINKLDFSRWRHKNRSTYSGLGSRHVATTVKSPFEHNAFTDAIIAHKDFNRWFCSLDQTWTLYHCQRLSDTHFSDSHNYIIWSHSTSNGIKITALDIPICTANDWYNHCTECQERCFRAPITCRNKNVSRRPIIPICQSVFCFGPLSGATLLKTL